MTTKLFVFIFLSLGFFHETFATSVCAKNGKDIAVMKDSFPKFLQDGKEIHFARSQAPVAYLSVKIGEEKISGEAKYKIPLFGIKQEKGYANQICFDNNSHELKIELDNGKDFKVKVINDNPPEATVTIKGYEMTRKPAEFNKAMAILNGTGKAAPAPAPAAAEANGGAQ